MLAWKTGIGKKSFFADSDFSSRCSKDRPQNGLYTIVELIFLMHHKTKGLATIHRWKLVDIFIEMEEVTATLMKLSFHH